MMMMMMMMMITVFVQCKSLAGEISQSAYTHTPIIIHTGTRTHIYTHWHTLAHAHAYIHTGTCTHIYTHRHSHTHIHTLALAHTCTRRHPLTRVYWVYTS